MNRRHFLMSSAAAFGAASTVLGSPNETVRMGVIGVGGHDWTSVGKGKAMGGRGKDHLQGLSKLANVEVAAVCDVDQSHLDYGIGLIEKATGKKPKAYADFRKLLEDKEIDAVSIATPNHWHTPIAIMACQAGKDVYVEKPCSHNMFEAKQVVAAARKYDRMVQQGSQIRSSKAVQEAMQKMREGMIGDVYLARGLCFKLARYDRSHDAVSRARGRGLRSVDGACAEARFLAQSLPLQLALVLGLRQWRPGQPRYP